MSTGLDVEMEQVRDLVYAKIAEIFEKSGKVWNRNLSRNYWEKPLELEHWIYGAGFGSTVHKYNAVLSLRARYYGKTVSKDGCLVTFREVGVKIPLSSKIEDVYAQIEKFLGKFPKLSESIQKAMQIEAERKVRADINESKRIVNANKIGRILGCEVASYGSISHGKPYEHLEVSKYGEPFVKVCLSMHVDTFESFHKAVVEWRGVPVD